MKGAQSFNFSIVSTTTQKIDLNRFPITEQMPPGVGVKVLETEEGQPKRLEVTLIEAGWSLNGFFYPDKVVEDISKAIIERNKLYLDHNDGFFSSPSRSFRDWAATAYDSRFKEGRAIADVEMTSNPETQWIYEEAIKSPESIGASIDAFVKVKEYDPEEEGENLTSEEKMNRRFVVEELVFLNSVDFVVYAGAKGKVNKVLASLGVQNIADFQHRFIETIDTLNVQLEQLNQQNNNPNRKEPDMPEENKDTPGQKPTLTLESLKSDYPELVSAIETAAKNSAEKELEAASKAEEEIQGLKDTIKAKEAEIDALTKEKDNLTSKVDDFEAKEAATEKRKKVDQLIKESELSDEFVTETFINDLMKFEKEEDMKTRIEERVNLVQSATTGVTGNGERPIKETSGSEVEEPDDDALVASIKGA